MTRDLDLEQKLRQLRDWYGDGADGSAPTAEQWRRALDRPEGAPLTLLNFFKLRDVANAETGVSGAEAFDAYAAVSIPTMERVGGRFLLVGPGGGGFIGEDGDWDVIAVGAYPSAANLWALYSDPDYRRAFAHRSAACGRQKVLICAA